MSDEKNKLSKPEAFRGLMVDLEAQRLQEEAEGMTKEQLAEANKASANAMDDAFASIQKAIAEAKAPEQPKVLPDNVIDIRTAKRAKNRFAAMVGAAALAVGSLAAAACVPAYMRVNKLEMVSQAEIPEPPSTGTAAGTVPPLSAAEFRTRAYEECFGSLYANCLDDLDRAKNLDPNGDTDPHVVNARKYAKRWMPRN